MLTIHEWCKRIEAGGHEGCSAEGHFISCTECPFGLADGNGECCSVFEKSDVISEATSILYKKYSIRKKLELL